MDTICPHMVAPILIWRYLLRDIFLHTILGLCVFTLILVVQNALRYVDELLTAGVEVGALAALVGVILPTYLAYAVPTSLLFGVLLAFGRLSADGEIIALRASGVSVVHLLPPVLFLGALAALATGYLLFDVEPRSRLVLRQQVRALAEPAKLVEPGRFRSLGSRVLYVHGKDEQQCPLRGVLIADNDLNERSPYISARCGEVGADPNSSGLRLSLSDGTIHFADPSQKRYRLIRFTGMQIGLDLSGVLDAAKRPRDFTFAELLELDRAFARGDAPRLRGRGGREAVRIQLHRRIAFPFAALLLAVVSVPLGIRPLRSGRSAGALTAIAVMTGYWLLFTAGEVVAEDGLLAPGLALWLPNALVAGLAVWLIRRTMRGDA